MAVSDAYATVEQYRALIAKSSTEDDDETQGDLLAISRYLDRRLGRFFTKDAAAVTREYMPSMSTLELAIDDLVSVTSIKTDDNNDGTAEITWASTDYQLRPINAADGAEAHPYTHIFVPSWSTKGSIVRNRLLQINGVWGWPAVPDAIRRATIHLTAILRLETPRAEAQVTELGQIMSMSPQARTIIDKLAESYSRKAYAV